MKVPNMFKAAGDGVSIQIGEWPGPGEAVLCVHGLTANLVCFSEIARNISVAHRVLAMDLRGRGRSDQPERGYSLEQHCRDISAVIGDLGLERVNLMGHSLGSYIGLVFAAEYPEVVSRLVLVDGGGALSAEQWEQVGKGIGPAVERLGKVSPSFEAYLEPQKAAPSFQPWNPLIEAYFQYEAEEVEGGVRSRVRPDNIAEERFNLATVKPEDYYPRVKCPVLILRATRGMLAPEQLLLPEDATERMLKSIARARVKNLEGADHYSIVFQPNPERDKTLLSFLAEPV
jgi:pimeloyl-ACP methyl ester carboxylesterase